MYLRISCLFFEDSRDRCAALAGAFAVMKSVDCGFDVVAQLGIALESFLIFVVC